MPPNYLRGAAASWRPILLAALLLGTPFTALGDVSGPQRYAPKGSFAGKSAGRCGAFTGSSGTTASLVMEQDEASVLSEADGLNLVVCEKHLREHKTRLSQTRYGGTKLKFQVFADSADLPESSSGFDVSVSSKSSSDSSPAAASSSSDSVAPELTTVSFVAELTPTPTGRRHMLEEAQFVTAIPNSQEVADINAWLDDFARDNSDVIVGGRDSITATSFKRGNGGVVFFTVFIITSDPDVVQARIVALPEYSSPAGDAILTEPQPCRNGEDVRFGAAEDLTAQLSVAPPAGCSNPLDPVVIVSSPITATTPPAVSITVPPPSTSTTVPPPSTAAPGPSPSTPGLSTVIIACKRRLLLGNRKLLLGPGINCDDILLAAG